MKTFDTAVAMLLILAMVSGSQGAIGGPSVPFECKLGKPGQPPAACSYDQRGKLSSGGGPGNPCPRSFNAAQSNKRCTRNRPSPPPSPPPPSPPPPSPPPAAAPICRVVTADDTTIESPYNVLFSTTALTSGNTQNITAAITNAPVGAVIKCGATNNVDTEDDWRSLDGFSLLASTVSNPVPLVSKDLQTVVAEGTVAAGGIIDLTMNMFVTNSIGSSIFQVTCMVKVAEPATCAGTPAVYDLDVPNAN